MRNALPLLLLAIAFPWTGIAQVTVHETTGKELPHTKYLEVVSQKASPLQKLYVKTGDGLYVAAAMRKPRGKGPFPAMLVLHGAPGGRGMEQLGGRYGSGCCRKAMWWWLAITGERCRSRCGR